MKPWTLASALEVVTPLVGLYSTEITEEERSAFNYLCGMGRARREWEQTTEYVRLAKVALVSLQ